jgi:dTDP-3-amino-2,3,6-trideoxy-4-keto-D-glucose/dTDP-3-amino-3,4,6-trideoxy-alpha-D-glucose/dTDP-2,6-dideoxy-D-kanosamine transaminase
VKVKYLDLPKQFKDEALWHEIKKIFETCQFIQGPEVERFEAKFANICRTPYALGLNSGTDAMFLALKALNIGPGDEVVTVPNSFIATAGAIIAAGAKPVFVDVAADYNIDVNRIAEAITSRTKAILPVHLTGNPADMGKIMEIAKRKNLFVIEDAAQAIMASISGKPVGSFGDAGCFSLHPLKNLNVCGDGGALTTQSQAIYEKVKFLRNHGLKNRDEIEFFGYNSRLDSIQAIVAEYGIKNLKVIQQKRQKNARIYDQGLKNLNEYITIPPRRKNVEQGFHTYVIRVQKRAELIRYLEENGIETKIHYPIPIHLQKPCQALGYQKGDFPSCEKQSAEILSLPIHQHLEEEHLDYVIGRIKNFYQRG